MIKRKSSGFAESQKDFNKITNKPKWILKSLLIAQNIFLNISSFLRIGEDMIVIGKKID